MRLGDAICTGRINIIVTSFTSIHNLLGQGNSSGAIRWRGLVAIFSKRILDSLHRGGLTHRALTTSGLHTASFIAYSGEAPAVLLTGCVPGLTSETRHVLDTDRIGFRVRPFIKLVRHRRPLREGAHVLQRCRQAGVPRRIVLRVIFALLLRSLARLDGISLRALRPARINFIHQRR